MAWHGGSEYGHSSQFQRLDRNGRARWRFLADSARRNRRLSPGQHDVATVLLRMLGADGRLDPSHETIARYAMVSPRTVTYAMKRLLSLGLVQWTRRIQRTREGARQTSNAYRLMMAGLEKLAVAVGPEPDRKKRGGTRTDIFLKAAPAAIAAALAVPADFPKPTESLAQINQRRAEALAAAWRQRRMA